MAGVHYTSVSFSLSGTGFMTDALRKGLMDLGVEKLFSALDCASGTHSLVTGVVEDSLIPEVVRDNVGSGAANILETVVATATGAIESAGKCQDVSEEVLSAHINNMTVGNQWGYMLKYLWGGSCGR